MSANFYDLLKCAATGIASPSMTYYDRMRASTLMGGAVQTLTGQPPLTFKADGTPLISWSMKGNGSQSGTPSPDNIIMPTFCGVRTAQLFDKSNRVALEGYIDNTGTIISNSLNVCVICKVAPNTSYTVSADMVCTNGNRIAEFTEKPAIGSQGTVVMTIYPPNLYRFTIITGQNAKYIAFHRSVSTEAERQEFYNKIMLNLGSTALPYEPFGYKIPITNAGQTTPVYLGQVSTVRRVKKLVLTGEENGWVKNVQTTSDAFYNTQIMTNYYRTNGYCSHLATVSSSQSTSGIFFGGTVNLNMPLSMGLDTIDKFKDYLAAQYASGTPVTVWYVLAEPQTGIVNEPLAKIGDYADELHSTDAGVTIPTVNGQNMLTVETDLQPSKMTIMYRK